MIAVLSAGFALGLQHALDADHVAAVATMVRSSDKGLVTVRTGMFWGIGHTATLLLVCLVIVPLNLSISGSAATLLEAVVGIMLVVLGLRVMGVWQIPQGWGEAVPYRSFLVGAVHGLAGSAALSVLVLATVESLTVGFSLRCGVWCWVDARNAHVFWCLGDTDEAIWEGCRVGSRRGERGDRSRRPNDLIIVIGGRMDTTIIIGVGNEFRRDDSVGLLAARKLAEQVGRDVKVTEASGEGMDLMSRWEAYDRVILVDATKSGAVPGTIHEFQASKEPIPTSFFNYSTHAFSVAEAIELARMLNHLPESVFVFGIEGRDFSTGQGLTEEVSSSLDEVMGRIRKLVSNDKEG